MCFPILCALSFARTSCGEACVHICASPRCRFLVARGALLAPALPCRLESDPHPARLFRPRAHRAAARSNAFASTHARWDVGHLCTARPSSSDLRLRRAAVIGGSLCGIRGLYSRPRFLETFEDAGRFSERSQRLMRQNWPQLGQRRGRIASIRLRPCALASGQSTRGGGGSSPR